MESKLFVYGTLMQGVPSQMSAYLQANAHFLGEAYAKGSLYDLGQYPGFLYDETGNGTVYGHLFQLAGAEQVFKILDPYEGILPDNSAENEYLRALISVQWKTEEVVCWTYLFNRLPQNLPLIPEGNYLNFYRSNPRHLGFIQG